jgi:hypothetical protein
MDNFDLRKFLIENKLTNNSKQIEEVNWKGLAAGAAMALGTLGAQGQEAPITQNPASPPMSQRDINIQKREEAKKKKEIHMTQVNAEILARAKRFGFDNVKDYMAWQAGRQKGPDAELPGLETGKANKRCDTKGSCTTGQTMGGGSLKDTK